MWLWIAAGWGLPAFACSCIEPTPSRTVRSPTRDVAVDAPLQVSLYGGWHGALRDRVVDDYRLVQPSTGETLPLHGELVGTVLDLHPPTPLKPSENYVLEVRHAYLDRRPVREAELRTLLQNSQPPEESLHLAWTPIHPFTTGPGTSRAAPDAPVVTTAFLTTRTGGGDCGPAEATWGTVDANASEGDLVSIEVEGQGIVWRGLPGEFGTSDSLCAPDPVHVPWADPLRLRAWLQQADGQVSPPSPWTTAYYFAPYADHPPGPVADHSKRQALLDDEGTALAAQLAALPVHASPPALSHAPLCPGGLQREEVDRLPAIGSRTYIQRAPLRVTGNAVWSFVADEDGLWHVHGLVGTPPVLPPLHGVKPWSDARGVVVADFDDTCTSAEGRNGAALLVTGSGADHTWTTLLETDGLDARAESIVADDQRVWVDWRSYRNGKKRLHQTILDRSTGATVDGDQPAPSQPHWKATCALVEGCTVSWTGSEPRSWPLPGVPAGDWWTAAVAWGDGVAVVLAGAGLEGWLVLVDGEGRASVPLDLTGALSPSVAVAEGEVYLVEGRWRPGLGWEGVVSRVVCRR
jgi:hypothetical protein